MQFKLGFPLVYGLTLYDKLGNYFFELHNKINTIHNNANNVKNILYNIQYYVRKRRLFQALAKWNLIWNAIIHNLQWILFYHHEIYSNKMAFSQMFCEKVVQGLWFFSKYFSIMLNLFISLHISHTAVSLVRNTIIRTAFKVIYCIKLHCSKLETPVWTYHDVLRHTTTPETCIRPKYIVIPDVGWLIL
jgi:hypothetical protein